MGSCLNLCNVCVDIESYIDAKNAKLVNEFLRIDSDMYCETCVCKRKGLEITESTDESICGNTCYYCILELKHNDNTMYQSPKKVKFKI